MLLLFRVPLSLSPLLWRQNTGPMSAMSSSHSSHTFLHLTPNMPGLGGRPQCVPSWIAGKTLLFTVVAAPAVPWQLLLAFLTPKRNEWVFNWSGHFPCEFLAACLFIFTRRKLGLQFVSVWGSKKAIIREISKPRLTWNYSQSYDPPGLASLCRHSLSLS